MTASIHPLTPRTRTDTLPDDMVNVTAEFFVDEGYQPEDILLLDPPNEDGARQVMEMMAALEASGS